MTPVPPDPVPVGPVPVGPLLVVATPDDDRLTLYRDLTDADLRRDVEGRARVFVVEGHLAVAALVGSGHGIHSMLLSERRAASLGGLVAAVRAAGAPVLVAPAEVLATTVGFNMHRGVVALGSRPEPADPAGLLRAARARPTPRVLVLEGVNDHENLGALFRNAAAFGVGAVLLDPTSADPLYRRSIRVSIGHVLTVPWARIPAGPAGIGMVAAAGFEVVALTPDPGAPALGGVPADRPIALLVGAEGPGLTAAALAAAGSRARIPMAAGVDSLNVATAAAVALHHLSAASGPGAP